MTVDENAIRERARAVVRYAGRWPMPYGFTHDGARTLAWDVLALLREREQMEKVVETARRSAHADPDAWDGYDGSGIHGYDPDNADRCSVCAALSVVSAPKSAEPADSLSREALDTEAVSESVSDKSPVEATGNTKEET